MGLFLRYPRLSALLLGAFAVLGFAPFYFYPASILALAGLFVLQYQALTPRQAAMLGFAFGLGLFGAGVYWIYISLHDFGGMPMLLALLATTAFCAFLALFPALAGWLGSKLPSKSKLLALPLLWVLQEWIRNWIFTGFPWLAVGYSQIPYSPLSGIAPVLGIYGVSLAVAACAALVAAKLLGQISGKRLALLLLTFWVSGTALLHVEWSQPFGQPLRFSLLQGNITQDLKWREDELQRTLQTYHQMTLASKAQLIVMPEMALPLLLDQLPTDYLATLETHARNQGGDVLVGIPEARYEPDGTHYFNSMLSYGSAPMQTYRKSHLVPFGEFIPFKPLLGWVYRELLHIPLADLDSGGTEQKPFNLSGQKVALNICYEDAFGEEIIRQLPEATLLVNTSNDAWYGESIAADQHLQLSQARALETSRQVLRATNTGATAAIERDGRILAKAPMFQQLSLDGMVQGYTGTTPYVRFGNWPVITLIFLALGVLWGRKKK